MLKFTRLLSQEGADAHQQVEWTKTDIIIKNQKTGEVIYECLDAEFPSNWSHDASKIVASKYFRQSRVGDQTETSVKQMVERVTEALIAGGIEQGYFNEAEGRIFGDELSLALYGQYGSFNSPVWFNLGVPGVSKPQCSACFINSVDDSMESILGLAKTEGLIFKDGSGSGVNLSPLRGSTERIHGGGHASGPVSFMSGYDAFANVILSGGRTRRAARMVTLDVDHPDIQKFISAKAEQEDVVRVLALAGMSTDFSDPESAYGIVKHQSGNNSVRVTDDFMGEVRDILHGYQEDAVWPTIRRTDGGVSEELSVRSLFRSIAEAAHKCGDPGLQFGDTIDSYNTCANDGEIVASNPCSEFVWLNDSACNLASLNLYRFSEGRHQFDHKLFKHVVRLFTTAQDIIVDLASYPTENITKNSHIYRTLGLGYANLGGLLMSWGLGYDSQDGRDVAAAITSCMTAYAYGTSAEIASHLGPFERFKDNKSVAEEVLGRQQIASKKLRKDVAGLQGKAVTAWRDAMNLAFKKGKGLRNAQVTLLAPTGTIAFMMDCATTGIEPDIGLKKTKTLVGGDIMEYVNPNVEAALQALEYDPEDQEGLLEYMREHGHFEGSDLRDEHLSVFDCAVPIGTRRLSTDAHVNMCAAVQPFLSGAISKTFNMAKEATVEDVERTFLKAWERGVKCITIYREGSKMSEPLRVREVKAETATNPDIPQRIRLPDERDQKGHKFLIGPHKGYITVGFYPSGKVGELFLRMAGHGSTVNGLLDSFGTLVSLALQYGIPLEELVSRFEGTRFAPSGWTKNPDIPSANSIIGYVFKWIRHKYLLDNEITDDRPSMLPPPSDEDFDLASEPCPHCGSQLRKVGATCYDCPNCSYNTGACS
jgi:ribonucleoside-diphosphate reductase alpha chain